MNNKHIDENELFRVNAGTDLEIVKAELIKNPDLIKNLSSSTVNSSGMTVVTKAMIELVKKRRQK